MRCLAFLALLLLIQLPALPVSAQLGSAYVEVQGNTRVYSFNIDGVFEERWGIRMGGAVDGIGFQTNQSNREPVESIVVLGTVNYFVGEWPHVLEAGIGLMAGKSDGEMWDFLALPAPTATLGYRRQTERSLFRVGVAPIVTRGKVLVSVGVSFGVSFRW